MKNYKKLISMFLLTTLVVTNYSPYKVLAHANDSARNESVKVDRENEGKGKLFVEDIEPEKNKGNLSKKKQQIINKAINASKKDGAKAGAILNEIVTDDDAVDIGVKEVLDTYYSEQKVNEKAVEEFCQTLNEDIDAQVAAYKEAREERDNEKNLDYVVGEEIVVFDKDTTNEEIEELVNHVADSYEVILDNNFEMDTSLSKRKQKRLKALEEYKGNIVVKVKLDLDQTVSGAAEEFEMYDCVVDACEDEVLEVESLATTLNDTYAGSQWQLDRCNFEDAWNTAETAGCDDIYVAVLDTGCRMTHKDLQGRLLTKYSVDVTQKNANGNYVKLSDMAKPYDSSHGTICTGIIAAKTGNQMGISGAASGRDNSLCKVMSIKVSSGVNSSGNEIITASDIYSGVKHAVNSGAEVISISICSSVLTSLYSEAAAYAEAANVVVVAAAGNYNNTEKRYMAALDSVISVGGTDSSSTNQKASFSSYGSWVNIVAPAVGYVSTTITSDTSYITGAQGTSFSTPLVASAAAVILSVNPNLSAQKVRNILYNTATTLNSSYFSCGLLNAGLAAQNGKYEEFKNSTVSLSSITALSGKKIKITWNDLNVYGPECVQIYRSTSKNGTYTKIKTLSAENTSYTDSGLTKGKTYYYKVRIGMKYGSSYKYTPYSGIKSAKAKN